jgi:hypothetical protein
VNRCSPKKRTENGERPRRAQHHRRTSVVAHGRLLLGMSTQQVGWPYCGTVDTSRRCCAQRKRS